jgi:hypothetical protein
MVKSHLKRAIIINMDVFLYNLTCSQHCEWLNQKPMDNQPYRNFVSSYLILKPL